MDVKRLGGAVVLQGGDVDATAAREHARQRRLAFLGVALGLLATWLWFRNLSSDPVGWGLPSAPAGRSDLMISFGLTLLLGLVIGVPLIAAGRSPHIVLRPSDTKIRLADVVGAEATKREAIDTLNLFLAHRTFADEMGGQPRRGVLFEGPPGTGQDLPGQGHGRRGRRAVPVRLGQRLPVDVLRSDQPEDPHVLPVAAQGGPARGRGHRLHRGVRRHRGVADRTWAAGAGREGRHGRRQRAARADAELRPAHRMESVRGPAGRPGQPPAARSPAPAPPWPSPGQRAAHRGHQPGQRPGSGTAPSRALRPHHPLRPARRGAIGSAIADYYLDRKAHAQ